MPRGGASRRRGPCGSGPFRLYFLGLGLFAPRRLSLLVPLLGLPPTVINPFEAGGSGRRRGRRLRPVDHLTVARHVVVNVRVHRVVPEAAGDSVHRPVPTFDVVIAVAGAGAVRAWAGVHPIIPGPTGHPVVAAAGDDAVVARPTVHNVTSVVGDDAVVTGVGHDDVV